MEWNGRGMEWTGREGSSEATVCVQALDCLQAIHGSYVPQIDRSACLLGADGVPEVTQGSSPAPCQFRFMSLLHEGQRAGAAAYLIGFVTDACFFFFSRFLCLLGERSGSGE